MEINLKILNFNKMKNIFKNLIYIMALTFVVISCDEDETTFKPLSYPTDAFVAFETKSFDLTEASGETVITVFIATVNQTEDVSIGFSIESTNAIEGTHYEIVGNKSSFLITSGNYTDEIRIKPIDNTQTDGNKELTINLTATSSGALAYPGPDKNGSSITVRILDDDCPLELIGEYNELSEDTNGIGGSGWKVEAGPNENEYWVTGFFSDLFDYWGESFQPGFGNEGRILMTDNGDGTVTIDCQYMGQTLPGPWDYAMSGSGTYSACNKTLSINAFFDDGVDACPQGWLYTKLVLELK